MALEVVCFSDMWIHDHDDLDVVGSATLSCVLSLDNFGEAHCLLGS